MYRSYKNYDEAFKAGERLRSEFRIGPEWKLRGGPCYDFIVLFERDGIQIEPSYPTNHEGDLSHWVARCSAFGHETGRTPRAALERLLGIAQRKTDTYTAALANLRAALEQKTS